MADQNNMAPTAQATGMNIDLGAGQPLGQQQAPQRDPLLPSDTPSIDEQLAMMKAEFSQQVKEQKQEQDLWAPETEDPSLHQEDVNDWLAPVQGDTSLPTVMQVGRDSEHYRHFEEQFANDPAIQAIAPQALELANGLHQQIKSGQMTHAEAMEHAGRILDKYATAHFEEHHGDESKTRSLIHPDVLAGTHRMGGR